MWNKNVIRLPKRIASWLCRLLLRLYPRSKNRRDILLISNRALMADYLAPFVALFEGDRRLRFHLLDHFDTDRQGGRDHIVNTLPFPLVSRRWAGLKRWDLMVTPGSGPLRDLVTCRRCPTLLTNHGTGTGKTIGGHHYPYSKRWILDDRGRLRFSRIFVPSHFIKDFATQRVPELDGTLSVVGDMRLDKMISKAKDREAVRRGLGFEPDDVVVFVISTWGPGNLFDTIGDPLLEAIGKLQTEFRFVLSAHYAQYHAEPDVKHIWGEYLPTQTVKYGFQTREQDEDWADYFVACDIVIADHGSLVNASTLLGRPLIFSPFPKELGLHNYIVEGSPIACLHEISPTLAPDASNLGDCLRLVAREYPYDKLKDVSLMISSCPGQSAEKMRQVTYDLLQYNAPEKQDCAETGQTGPLRDGARNERT